MNIIQSTSSRYRIPPRSTSRPGAGSGREKLGCWPTADSVWGPCHRPVPFLAPRQPRSRRFPRATWSGLGVPGVPAGGSVRRAGGLILLSQGCPALPRLRQGHRGGEWGAKGLGDCKAGVPRAPPRCDRSRSGICVLSSGPGEGGEGKVLPWLPASLDRLGWGRGECVASQQPLQARLSPGGLLLRPEGSQCPGPAPRQ